MTKAALTPPLPQLRDAHRALTRNRICETARELFFANGYAATTMDQIATASVMRRSTLYVHFRDKDEILTQIARDYAEKALRVVEELPTGRQSRAELERWIKRTTEFVASERIPTVLFSGFGEAGGPPQAASQLAEQLMTGLASRVPAFRIALSAGPHQMAARARCEQLLRELGHLGIDRARNGDTAYVGESIMACTELFEALVERWPD